jgi:hypothetical protein
LAAPLRRCAAAPLRPQKIFKAKKLGMQFID